MNGTDDGGKPAQTGLVDMGNIAFFDQNGATLPTFTPSDLNNFAGSFSEMVLNVTWAQLQPTEGAVDTSAIDDAIQQLQAFNTSHGTDVGIKLRVWGGFTAPDWAKIIDGPAITITGQNSVDPNVYDPQTMGRVWTADYIDAWTNLQNSLAALYDSNPLIRGISQTAGAVTSDEPFVPLSITAPTSDAPNAPTINQPAELQAGGYNDAAEALTLRAAIADYAAWSTTPLDYTMNNHYVFDSGVEHDDPNFTLDPHGPAWQSPPARPDLRRRQFSLQPDDRRRGPYINGFACQLSDGLARRALQAGKLRTLCEFFRSLCKLARHGR